MDKTDEQILKLLQGNARISFQKLWGEVCPGDYGAYLSVLLSIARTGTAESVFDGNCGDEL